MSLIVEIHVPLDPAGPLDWIDDVEEFLAEQEESGAVETYDDGEELGDVYVFFVTGRDEGGLLAVASRVAARPGVPAGAFAVVTDESAGEIGDGRRVPLPR